MHVDDGECYSAEGLDKKSLTSWVCKGNSKPRSEWVKEEIRWAQINFTAENLEDQYEVSSVRVCVPVRRGD